MPFQSESQRRFMWANHPDIADKWAHGEESSRKGPHRGKRGGYRNLPYRKSTRSRRRK